jgi:precorrin-2 dehydrogenase/sirohydrochlorin ferrochelatase
MRTLFPIFLKLAGRPCLVVGAGQIAAQKIEALLLSGAQLTVVAPQASQLIQSLAHAGRLTWIERAFTPSDLDDMTIVIGATGDATVNEEVFRNAVTRRVLCNAVDEPERCHFYYPAVVRRGDLQIAISTNGHSPALAQRLRAELEALIVPEYEGLLQWLGRVRTMLFRRVMDPQLRRKTLHRIASHEVSERFLRARRSSGKERIS